MFHSSCLRNTAKWFESTVDFSTERTYFENSIQSKCKSNSPFPLPPPLPFPSDVGPLKSS